MKFFALVFACIVVGTPALAASGDSRTAQELLLAYQREDPVVVLKLARPLADKGLAEAQFIMGLFQDIGAGVRIDHPSALIWLEKAAAQNHSPAMLLLAWKYEKGFGVDEANPAVVAKWRSQAQPFDETSYARWFPKTGQGFAPNFNRAFLWMLDQLDGKNRMVMLNLAEVYLSAHWTNADAEQHLQWVEQAAESGEMEAVEVLSLYYDMGLFVKADPAKALALRQQAAGAGKSDAQYMLAKQFEEGRTVEQNITTAITWYEKAAKQEHIASLQRLIVLRRYGTAGLPPDFKEAVRLAERGHKMHDAESTRQLADLYNRGDGVERNFAKSAELYHEAAAKGEISAMCMLGWIYGTGELGSPDYPEARRWYQQAAELGHVRSMKELGEMHEKGLGGPKDSAEAFIWYERAARLGDKSAQNSTGEMLLQGRGIPQDAEEAVEWFRLANQKRPENDFNPNTKNWKKLGEVRVAFDGILAVARQETDIWLVESLSDIRGDDPKIRPDLENEIIRLAEDPDLLKLPGILPEGCLVFLEDNPDDGRMQPQAERLFQQLLAADRPQSALLLGRYALAGHRMARDLARAAHWAKIAVEQTPWQGKVLAALINYETATDGGSRSESWNVIRKFAAGADPDAICAVARRVLDATATLEEQNWAKRYSFHVFFRSRQLGENEFHRRFDNIIKQLPPDEKILKEKIASLQKSRPADRNTQAIMIHKVNPYYPRILKKKGVVGEVIVEFVVDAAGRTSDITVVESNDPLFSLSTVDAVRYWRFAPAQKNGVPVSMKAQQKLQFLLAEENVEKPK